MKLALYEIRNTEKCLGNIAKSLVPVKTSYKIALILNALRQEVQAMEVARLKLIQKYSDDPDEKGNISVKNEHQDAFKQEWSEFLVEEKDLDMDVIYLDELGDIKIAPDDLAGAVKLLQERPEKK